MEESGSFRKLYVEKCFRLKQAKAEKMIKNIFIAFENRINNLA
jgi:endothelin-converting enzyme/putative endopeptidase